MKHGDTLMTAKPAEQFYQKELYCEQRFREGGPYWHLCTPGTEQEIIFSSREEMIAGMNLLAITATEFKIKIYTECLMNNHLHILLECEEAVGLEFFKCFKKRLSRLLTDMGKVVDLKHFNVEGLIPVDSLEDMRKEIVYVNRNGYAANRNHNPFTYPWGSGCLYFNDVCGLWRGISFKELTYREKQRLIHTRLKHPDLNLTVNEEGLILPASYCFVKDGELFFRDNWHYFSMLTKNYEAYGLVAKRIGESYFLTDEELYPAVCGRCMSRYNVKWPKQLTDSQKREMIIYMHSELSSTNEQIRRILNIDINVVNELFPLSAKRI